MYSVFFDILCFFILSVVLIMICIAAIKYHDQKKREERFYFSLQLKITVYPDRVREGTQGKLLEAVADSEAMEYWLVLSAALNMISYTC